MEAIGAILAAAMLLAVTATVVSVRTARSVASLDHLRELAAERPGRGASAVRTVEEPDRSVEVLQVILPVAAVVAGWLLSIGLRTWWTGRWGPTWLVLAAVVSGLLGAFVVDALPRAAGLAAPERVLLALGWVYRGISAVVAPVVTVSGWMASAVLLPVGMWLHGGRGRGHTADELAELAGAGGIAEQEPGLLVGALGFGDVTVADVMAAREQLVTVPRTSTVSQAEELVHRSGHSRVLVVGSSGEVTGFLHAKDLLTLPETQREGLLPAGLVRVALRVEPGDRISEVLLRMRRARRHVAVVEEGTELVGLVTLEDVLEAIVGDIRDESDQDRPGEGEEGDGGEVAG